MEGWKEGRIGRDMIKQPYSMAINDPVIKQLGLTPKIANFHNILWFDAHILTELPILFSVRFRA